MPEVHETRLIDLLEANRLMKRWSKRHYWRSLGIPQTTYYRWLKGQRPTIHWERELRGALEDGVVASG